MTTLEILQRMKREWTPAVFTQHTAARSDNGTPVNPTNPYAVSFCFRGKVAQIIGSDEVYFSGTPRMATQEDYDAALAITRRVADRIAYAHPEFLEASIEAVNDSRNGYAILSDVIDQLILAETRWRLPSDVMPKAEQRDLVTA